MRELGIPEEPIEHLASSYPVYSTETWLPLKIIFISIPSGMLQFFRGVSV